MRRNQVLHNKSSSRKGQQVYLEEAEAAPQKPKQRHCYPCQRLLTQPIREGLIERRLTTAAIPTPYVIISSHVGAQYLPSQVYNVILAFEALYVHLSLLSNPTCGSLRLGLRQGPGLRLPCLVIYHTVTFKTDLTRPTAILVSPGPTGCACGSER